MKEEIKDLVVEMLSEFITGDDDRIEQVKNSVIFKKSVEANISQLKSLFKDMGMEVIGKTEIEDYGIAKGMNVQGKNELREEQKKKLEEMIKNER